MTFDLPGDSQDYHLLTKGVELSSNVEGLTLEIGLRRGGGTKYIIDALAQYAPHKVHVAVDPYGSILYADRDGLDTRLDYTNDMAGEALPQIYGYAHAKKIRFLFFQLEDIEFFRRFGDGVPVYNHEKKLEFSYSFIHFDGPHSLDAVMTEAMFLLCGTPKGACWCFDDIGNYDHDKVEQFLFTHGFGSVAKTGRKALYQCIP